MYPKSTGRKIEVLVEDNWVPVSSFGLLEIGDIIRVFEPDGSPVVSNGSTIFGVIEQPALVVEPQ